VAAPIDPAQLLAQVPEDTVHLPIPDRLPEQLPAAGDEERQVRRGADVAGTSDVISLVVTNVSGGNEQYLAAIDWIALT
jgi:hypothetical protein